MNLGERLIHLRKIRNITQQDLAKSLKVSRGAVSMWEINQRTPDPETLQKLADFFGCSVDYLLGRNESLREQNDPFTPAWWYRDTPPTKMELEEFLKQANVYFDGAPLNEEDKEDILDYLAWKWEREKKKREKKQLK